MGMLSFAAHKLQQVAVTPIAPQYTQPPWWQHVPAVQAKQSASSPDDLDNIITLTKELKERQETPDPPEALLCIPSLQLSDIPKTIATIPTAKSEVAGTTLLTHDLFTNDVLYMETAFDLTPLPANLLSLVPLFCR